MQWNHIHYNCLFIIFVYITSSTLQSLYNHYYRVLTVVIPLLLCPPCVTCMVDICGGGCCPCWDAEWWWTAFRCECCWWGCWLLCGVFRVLPGWLPGWLPGLLRVMGWGELRVSGWGGDVGGEFRPGKMKTNTSLFTLQIYIY